VKKFFSELSEPYNLLFAASAVIFAQFFITVIYFYAQAVIYRSVNDLSYYAYMPYCAGICVISLIIIFKVRPKTEGVKLWFAGLFIYALFEMAFFVMILLSRETIFDEKVFTDLTYALYDDHVLYRLYLCAAMILAIYCATFFKKNKKAFIIFGGANLLLVIALTAVIFSLSVEYFLLYGDENIFTALLILAGRDAGVLLYMLNMFAFGLHGLDND